MVCKVFVNKVYSCLPRGQSLDCCTLCNCNVECILSVARQFYLIIVCVLISAPTTNSIAANYSVIVFKCDGDKVFEWASRCSVGVGVAFIWLSCWFNSL